ncbi:hypothetical protein R3P38DRAFT_3205704 [Favolaschia claudopus]|uniref:Uncharacterized protein n=1 Tax=Favolaschia claudopus TaxID=2862362 RepID=A0AAW0ALX5_9AGAR
MTFELKDPYFNPARARPSAFIMRPTGPGMVNAYRINYGKHVAIAVLPGMCTESHIMSPVASAGTPPRYRKYISLLVHNQDWERTESFVGICFGQDTIHCAINAKALQLSTRLNPVDTSKEVLAKIVKKPLFRYIESPKKSDAQSTPREGAGGPSSQFSSAYSLKYDDEVPVYDARGVDFDFHTNIRDLSTMLPRWKGGEVPIGSFIVAGFTMASFMGKAQGMTEKTLHVGNNILWVVICGTPIRSSSD